MALLVDALALKRAGDIAFGSHAMKAAALKHRQCLHVLNTAADNIIIALLQNLSIANTSLQNHSKAFMHAAAVLALFPSDCHPKACFHAAKAAAAMGFHEAASWLLEHIPLSSRGPPVYNLAKSLDLQNPLKSAQDHHPVVNCVDFALAALQASLQLPDCPDNSSLFKGSSMSESSGEQSSRRSASDKVSRLLPSKGCDDQCNDAKHNSSIKQPQFATDDPEKAFVIHSSVRDSPHDASGALEAQLHLVAALKEEGSALFKAGDVPASIQKWTRALAELDILSEVVPKLAEAEIRTTADRSMHGKGGEQHTVMACVALMWRPANALLHQKRAEYAGILAKDLDHFSMLSSLVPILCVEQGSRMLPEDSALRCMHGELTAKLQMHNKMSGLAEQMRSGGNLKSYAEKKLEQETGTSRRDNNLQMGEMGGVMARAQMSAVFASNPQVKAAVHAQIGEMPDGFDEAFLRTPGVPRGCDVEKCRMHLAAGAEDAFMQYFTLAGAALASPPIRGRSATPRRVSDEEVPTLADPLGGTGNPVASLGAIMTRLSGGADLNPDLRMRWWRAAPQGSVQWRLPSGYHNLRQHLHTFSNVPRYAFPVYHQLQHEHSGHHEGANLGPETPERMHVHVGVGFVDLGEVAETFIEAEKNYKGDRNSMPAFGMEWHGFDASAHSCAQTLIINQMLQNDDPTDCILQVWYSAAWSEKTLDHFHAAVATLLDSQPSNTPSGEVTAWLRAWRTAKVPLKKSRREWLRRQVKSSCNIANACSPKDQQELCAYRLTGQLLEVSTGSVPMFVLLESPGTTYNYADEEGLLDTIAPEALMEAHRGLTKSTRTLMAAGVAVARQRIEALRSAIRAGTLRVQVHHATVSPTDRACIAHIAALKPDSMSWSNVPEYMQPQAFHHTARACSLPHTRHFLHAMNWVYYTKGTCVLDTCELPSSSPGTVKKRVKILKDAHADIAGYLRELSAQGVLRHPPLDNRMNVTDGMLARQMHCTWLDAFVRTCQVGVVATYTVLGLWEPRYWYFCRAGSVIHFEIQYSSLKS